MCKQDSNTKKGLTKPFSTVFFEIQTQPKPTDGGKKRGKKAKKRKEEEMQKKRKIKKGKWNRKIVNIP